MKNTELLTVKKFADKVGLSSQAIYKLLDNKLFPFVTTVDNKKMVSSEALELFNNKPKEEELTTASQPDLQLIINEKNERIEELKDRIEDLKNQIQTLADNNEKLMILLSQQQNLTLKLQAPKEKKQFFPWFRKNKEAKEE